MKTISPFAHPMYIMAKPVGASCNLRCKYCYYLEKAKMYDEDSHHIMDDNTLEMFIKDYIGSQTMNQILFTWHGGEPLLRPLSFYEKVMKLEQKYARGKQIDNCIQTNGTLINDDWARFFHDNGWLVGVSIDGDETIHDKYRKTAVGKSSFLEVMNGIKCLNKYGVEWNAMAVVNNLNGKKPLEFYHFFKNIGCHYIQFTPIVDSSELGILTEYSVTPEQWGAFCCAIFDEWVREDVGDYFIQLFDATLANWVGVEPGICSMAKTCGHVGVIEYNGDVYSCDHFVFPRYKLGNIHENTLVEMMYGKKQKEFGEQKSTSLPTQCRQCQWLFACNGECPKNRFIKTADGKEGLNYLCEGYKMFFNHVAPYMYYMKERLNEDEAPADIMEAIKKGEL